MSLRHVLRQVTDDDAAEQLGSLNGDWRTRRCVANVELYLNRAPQEAPEDSSVKIWSRADAFLDAVPPLKDSQDYSKPPSRSPSSPERCPSGASRTPSGASQVLADPGGAPDPSPGGDGLQRTGSSEEGLINLLEERRFRRRAKGKRNARNEKEGEGEGDPEGGGQGELNHNRSTGSLRSIGSPGSSAASPDVDRRDGDVTDSVDRCLSPPLRSGLGGETPPQLAKGLEAPPQPLQPYGRGEEVTAQMVRDASEQEQQEWAHSLRFQAGDWGRLWRATGFSVFLFRVC